MSRRNWTRDESILALFLYFQIPFGKIDHRNPDLIQLANRIGRTPSAIAWKLANFSSLDPKLQERGIRGATHGSQLDAKVWEEFVNDSESLVSNIIRIYSEIGLVENEIINSISIAEQAQDDSAEPRETEKQTNINIRVGQKFFRKAVFTAYENRCCISGIDNDELLNASHIVPWRKDKKNRLNPRNGLCLNVFWDRCFDRGIITITTDYFVKVSNKFRTTNPQINSAFEHINNQKIFVPKKFSPDVEFIKFHNDLVFWG
jgi:putative restriction endonuclease